MYGARLIVGMLTNYFTCIALKIVVYEMIALIKKSRNTKFYSGKLIRYSYYLLRWHLGTSVSWKRAIVWIHVLSFSFDILTDSETFDTIIGSNLKYWYSIYLEYWYTALSVIHLIKISLSYIFKFTGERWWGLVDSEQKTERKWSQSNKDTASFRGWKPER